MSFLLHLPNIEPLGTVCGSVLFTENTHYILKIEKKENEKRKSRICIYSINAPHQNYDLYVVF